MIKSSLYIILSIISIFASALVIVWIIQRESEKDKTIQKPHIILNGENRDKKNISNQAARVDYDKKDIDSALSDIDRLVNSVEKTEVLE